MRVYVQFYFTTAVKYFEHFAMVFCFLRRKNTYNDLGYPAVANVGAR